MPMNGLFILAMRERRYLTWRCIWTIPAHKAYSHFYSTCTGPIPLWPRSLNTGVRCSIFAPILMVNTHGIARFTFLGSDRTLSLDIMSSVDPDGGGSCPFGAVTTIYLNSSGKLASGPEFHFQ